MHQCMEYKRFSSMRKQWRDIRSENCGTQWPAEGLGYPGPTSFLHAPPIKIVLCDLRKYFYVRVKIIWRPFIILHDPCQNLSSLSFAMFSIYLRFFKKTASLDAPPGRMPGAVAPPAPPLHATGGTYQIVSSAIYAIYECCMNKCMFCEHLQEDMV